ncbi:MAG: hypothetical protein Q7K57_04715 [Burkholderiaceae bacterium]|nr:hypothetical protein [Burkholderiaceae bacterium]
MTGLRTSRLAMASRLLGLSLLLAASPAVWADAWVSQATSSRVPKPVIETARGDTCVEDPAFMRRNHMTLLKHQRDDTLRGGIRTSKYSLKACIACHASQATDSVTVASTNFCQSCHNYAAVKIDCFECHASKPPQTSFHPLLSHGKPGDKSLSLQLRQMVVQQQVKP